jgi:hypothetical protein
MYIKMTKPNKILVLSDGQGIQEGLLTVGVEIKLQSHN